VLALHGRPVQPFPLLFVPALFAGTWLHLDDRHRDGAALTASASGLYALLAYRRKQPGGFVARFTTVRGVSRGMAIGLGMLNCAAGSWTYLTRSEEMDRRERREQDRWGKEATKTNK